MVLSIDKCPIVAICKGPFEKVTMAYMPFMVPLMMVWIALAFIFELSLWLPNLVLGPD